MIVTSHGRPVLKVVPIRSAVGPDEVFADVRGRVRLPGVEDLTAPLGVEAFADSDVRDLIS